VFIEARNNPEGGRPSPSRCAASNAQAPVRTAATRHDTLPRSRVLVADDHAEVSKAVRRLLALECDIVGHVEDGSAAVDAAQRLNPTSS
jgi:PleD family two-component response regulator